MEKNHRLLILVCSIVATITMVFCFGSYAADFEQEKKALDIIADFADKFCKDVNQKGDAKSIEIGGDAKAKLKGVIDKVADLGFEGAAKYKSESYEGLIRTDLLPALKDNNACRLQIWNDLKGKLLQPSNNSTGGNPTAHEIGINVAVMQDEQTAFGDDPTMNISYESTKNDKQTIISPRVDYLDLIRNGGPIGPIDFTWTPFQLNLPILDIKVVNNTDQTLFINEAIIDIDRSQLDPEPILLIKSDSFRSNSLHFRILNEGWGAASNVKIAFNIEPQIRNQSSIFSGPYNHSVTLPTIDNHIDVDISDAFAQAGVKLEELQDLKIRRYTYGGGEDTITVRDKKGEELTMTRKEFEMKRASLLGPFVEGGGLVSGIISYNSLQPNGNSITNELRFSTIVWIYDENLVGINRPPSYAYSTKFKVTGEKYSRRVNMSQEIKPGETDRFTLKIGVEKSSLHAFNLRLIYNGTKELQAGSFQLSTFVPRSSAGLLASKESGR